MKKSPKTAPVFEKKLAQCKERVQQLQTCYQATSLLNAELNFPILLNTIMTLAKQVAKADASNPAGIGVSIFVDPDAVSVRIAKNLGADTVEICTTTYAAVTGKLKQNAELEKLELAAYLAHELGLELHAGHDLDYHNVQAVARIPHMECLNIGFAVMARSMFTGLRAAVGEMKKLIASAR